MDPLKCLQGRGDVCHQKVVVSVIALWVMLVVLMLLSGMASASAAGDSWSDVDRMQIKRIRALRQQVAGEIQLTAYDLLDELVYGWSQSPFFATPTPVVLAEISVPVGLGIGMQSLLENHLNAVLIKHPQTHIQLSHCPACTAVVIHSGAKGTVVSRGYDNPKGLQQLIVQGANKNTIDRHALFIDIEAEGKWLVMRARLTKLVEGLPIVWTKTISTSSNTPSMLRQAHRLSSAAEARAEYLNALRERGPTKLLSRFNLRTFARGNSAAVISPPLAWFQMGMEYSPTQASSWAASIMLGYAFMVNAYNGLMVQARFSRLLSGTSHSLTRPDLYLFYGGALMTVSGPATVSLRDDIRTVTQVLADADLNKDSRTTYGAWQVGFELRMGNRIGVSLFLETIPTLDSGRNIGNYWDIGIVDFETFGTEVTLCF